MRNPFAARSRFAPAAKRFMTRYLETMAVADPTGLGWHPAYWPEPHNTAPVARIEQLPVRPVPRPETARPRTHHAA